MKKLKKWVFKQNATCNSDLYNFLLFYKKNSKPNTQLRDRTHMVSLTDLRTFYYDINSQWEKSSGHLITFKSSSSKYKVFPGSIAMDFIFEFAIIGWVFAKLRLVNDKIWSTRTIIADFSYVNRNRNGFSVVICIGKESNHWSDWCVNQM